MDPQAVIDAIRVLENLDAPHTPPPPPPLPTNPPLTQENLLTYIADTRRCHYCPHPADYDELPPLPLVDFATAAKTRFDCGCEVHTKCFLFYGHTHGVEMPDILRCPVCRQQPIFTENERIVIRRRARSPGRDTQVQRLTDLWQNDEVFQESVKKLAKLNKTIAPLEKEYRQEKLALVEEWKQTTMTSIAFLKEQKKTFTKRLSSLPNRKKYLSAYTKFSRAAHRLENTYNMGWRGFDILSEIQGVPRMRRNTHYYRFSETAWRLFRVRI